MEHQRESSQHELNVDVNVYIEAVFERVSELERELINERLKSAQYKRCLDEATSSLERMGTIAATAPPTANSLEHTEPLDVH